MKDQTEIFKLQASPNGPPCSIVTPCRKCYIRLSS